MNSTVAKLASIYNIGLSLVSWSLSFELFLAILTKKAFPLVSSACSYKVMQLCIIYYWLIQFLFLFYVLYIICHYTTIAG